MAFLDDAGSAPDTQEPPDPEADARAAALTPDRAAILALEIDALSTQLIARAIEMGMTFKGFAMTMAHNWDAKRRQFDHARAAGEQLARALHDSTPTKEARPVSPDADGAATPTGAVDAREPAGTPAGPAATSCHVEGCDEPQAHTHLVSGRIVLIVPGVDCPLIDCNIPGPHDHGVDEGQDATKQEPR